MTRSGRNRCILATPSPRSHRPRLFQPSRRSDVHRAVGPPSPPPPPSAGRTEWNRGPAPPARRFFLCRAKKARLSRLTDRHNGRRAGGKVRGVQTNSIDRRAVPARAARSGETVGRRRRSSRGTGRRCPARRTNALRICLGNRAVPLTPLNEATRTGTVGDYHPAGSASWNLPKR